ncbi:spore germination protein [Clostridium magnum]|uniref:Spore germination protein B1 n=1 Tax=Clostridium magnum DSM 2767 TaxID=1121326 RepID=A0A162R7H0_9CLOT|nr:spore germination protein [Clostridium magnum]KZL89544.1 spore germination protein B1 [Clostridium magnum DSM 2767]SHH71840.1 GerA spore germination protein [Clostridium magnum DSM 2767]
MPDSNNNIACAIEQIKNLIGGKSKLAEKHFIIGKQSPKNAAIVYTAGLVNKDIIDRDILTHLMLHVEEDLNGIAELGDYLCKKYIAMSNTEIQTDINKAVEGIKRGKTVVLVEGYFNFIMIDTAQGSYRSVTDPENESSTRGPRDGFIESLETNISMLRRRIKDKNFIIENFTVGRRSQTDLVIMYIDDIVDKNLLKKIRNKITDIDISYVSSNAILEQCLEEHTYSIFPQIFYTERPDRVQAGLMEGKIAILLDGTPFALTLPTMFVEFFETVEDYYNRTLVASFNRMIRYIAAVLVLTLPGVYITIIKFNSELIPSAYIQSLIEAREGLALTPFMSMLSMNLVIEFLREGGLRLPGKIGQTLSVVGGIIIGDAALKAKIVSSSTLLVVGITTAATFLIPNYEMSLSIRFLNYPAIIMANWLGMLGVVIVIFFIIAYLCSLDSFGVPYFSFYQRDMKDTFVRAPMWNMNKRPEAIPNNNPTKQTNWQNKLRGKKNG